MNFDYSIEIPSATDFLELYLTTGWDSYKDTSVETIKKALQNSWFVQAVYDKNKLIGVGRLISDGFLQALLVDMIIHPEYQRKGIGTILLRKLIEYCHKYQIRILTLYAAPNKSKFYERQGFVRRPLDAPCLQMRLF